MKTIIGHRISPYTITVTFDDGQPHIISADHPKFAEIGAKLKANDFEGLAEMISPADVIRTWFDGRVVVKGGVLTYKGEAVNLTIVPTILDMVAAGDDPIILVSFLDRLMQNPSMRSRNQLWTFIEKNGITLYNQPTVPDGVASLGWLVLYKGVNADYTDCHSGKIDNHPGKWPPAMNRSQIDDDPTNGCSFGYHAGDYAYVKSFGVRKLIVLVDPADVVCIPSDSSFTKLRITQYYVLSEVEADKFKDFEETTYGDNLDEDEGEDEDETYEITYTNGDTETVTAANFEDAQSQASDVFYVASIVRL